MTLYDEVCKFEKLINARRNAANKVFCRMGEGISFDDEYDAAVLKRCEIARLLENPIYDENLVVQRMKNGESLVGILDESLARRTYGLRFRWGKRKKFNQRVEPFKEIVFNNCHGLEQGYFLHPLKGIEGTTLYPVCYGYILGSIGTLAGQAPIGFIEHLKNPDALNVGFAILLGLAFLPYYSGIIKRDSRYNLSRIREECKEFDKASGRT